MSKNYDEENRSLKQKRKSCEHLILQILGTDTMVRTNSETEERMIVSDDLKNFAIQMLFDFRESDSLREKLFEEVVGDTLFTDYLSLEPNGVVAFSTDAYSYGIDGHFREHYFKPEEVLYRFSIVQEAQNESMKNGNDNYEYIH